MNRGILFWFFLTLSGLGGVAQADTRHLQDLREAMKFGDAPEGAAAQTALVDYLDKNRGNEIYSQTIAELTEYVFKIEGGTRDDASLALSSARILCRVLPWDSGDHDNNKRIQKRLHAIFEKAFAGGDIIFARFLDCAHANTTGGYFEFLEAFYKMYDIKNCDHFDSPTKERVKRLLGLGYASRREMAGSSGSYYRPRMGMRIATLQSALGIFALRDGDFNGAEEMFRSAYEVIGKWNSVEKLRDTRNGWRLYSDLFVLEAFYGFLAGDRESSLDLMESQGMTWKPLLEQKEKLEVEFSIVKQIVADENLEYRDPVQVDRLLPGAGRSEGEECSRWFRYGFPTRELSASMAGCLRRLDGGIIDVGDLEELDACIASNQPTDWWLQLGAYSARKDAIDNIEFLEVRYGAGLNKRAELRGLLKLGVVDPGRESRFYRIRTTNPLSRVMVQMVQDRFKEVLPSWSTLIGRSKHY